MQMYHIFGTHVCLWHRNRLKQLFLHAKSHEDFDVPVGQHLPFADLLERPRRKFFRSNIVSMLKMALMLQLCCRSVHLVHLLSHSEMEAEQQISQSECKHLEERPRKDRSLNSMTPKVLHIQCSAALSCGCTWVVACSNKDWPERCKPAGIVCPII